ncbi:MAG: Purine cyclase-related protein [uncultured Solirubrobacterales bacterium]|uniref:Purine cyclase-related protein n=1 Tax=uncultured Solirubrobacterales bacterium TaxID=768556 RepID=A0A6J4SN99_9ACTN|nr:MAG: Purine cyclase-related protein [uncultured Solirubrobacterales bacterium]
MIRSSEVRGHPILPVDTAPQLPRPQYLASRLRAAAGWANERPDLMRAVRMLRDFLPGDAEFGDPYSTAGNEPAQLVGRRLWAINHSRWSAAGEAGLAFLQVAEWVTRRDQAREEIRDVAIVFTDLVGFSSWALEAGDDRSIELLRRVGATVEGCIEAHGGRLIKRLGDGVMAVFEEPADALTAMHEAIERVADLRADGYRVLMRAGLHVGQARRLGGDYLGVDVNVASRICEDAQEGEALISRPVLDRLDGAPVKVRGRRTVERPGVPRDLEVYAVELDGHRGSD